MNFAARLYPPCSGFAPGVQLHPPRFGARATRGRGFSIIGPLVSRGSNEFASFGMGGEKGPSGGVVASPFRGVRFCKAPHRAGRRAVGRSDRIRTARCVRGEHGGRECSGCRALAVLGIVGCA
jgi:hypothetical protein